MRNPPWKRDELILALDVYFSYSFNSLNPKHLKIQELSQLLSKLATFDTVGRTTTFRNPQGVYMKLGHFLGIDPTDPRRGLPGHGKLDKVIFTEYAERRQDLTELAEVVKKAIADENLRSDLIATYNYENEEFAVREGGILFRLHRFRERDRTIVKKKKLSVLRLRGRLDCEVCGFNFEAIYGDIGKGFAECHHINPVGLLRKDAVTTLRDLAIVCANCHRMLHRNLNLSIENLRRQVKECM